MIIVAEIPRRTRLNQPTAPPTARTTRLHLLINNPTAALMVRPVAARRRLRLHTCRAGVFRDAAGVSGLLR